MKRVHTTSMVAHLWANQSQPEARNSCRSFYFEGPTIYSYGGHFPIATHVSNARGERAVLFTTRTYSVTTSGHINDVHRALHGLSLEVIPCSRPNGISHSENRESYEVTRAALLRKAAKARGRQQFYLEEYESITAVANRYAEFFGLRGKDWKFAPLAGNLKEQIDAAKRRIKTEDERARKQRELREEELRKRQAMRAAELEVDAAAWSQGLLATMPRDYPRTLLRIKDDMVETSRGAEVPVYAARRLWYLIAKCQANGRAWTPDPQHTFHVGSFGVREIEPSGNVRIGCHYIEWSEVARIAKELGLLDSASDCAAVPMQ